MKRSSQSFFIEDINLFKQKLFAWSRLFNEVAFLDSNTSQNHQDIYSSFDFLLAVEGFTSIKTDSFNGFEKLNDFQKNANDWLFGFLSFDLKEDTYQLPCKKSNSLDFPSLYFFQPKKIILIKDNVVYFYYLPLCDEDIFSDYEAINNTTLSVEKISQKSINFKQRTSKESYIIKANQLLQDIQLGNIYEVNYCIEFYDDDANINPHDIFFRLNALAKSPFASFFRIYDKYIICASPERFLKRKGNKLISQPIKGTARRFEDENEDLISKNNLKNNAKEISENIMIVDLVRNDLSITAEKGSVSVEELCEVYTFNQVHQMISTIVSEVKHGTSATDVLKTTFPMGSMTGAPKFSALQLIEKHEDFRRGVYSGSVGYFDPNGNFDFNVIIRSLLYNSTQRYLSYSAGSALTAQANPQQEYEECLLKAKIIHQIFKT